MMGNRKTADASWSRTPLSGIAFENSSTVPPKKLQPASTVGAAGVNQPAVLRNACDTAPGLNCFKTTEQGARCDQRDEKVHNPEHEKRREDLVAGHFVRQTHKGDGLEHAETAGNMADNTRRQGDDENRQYMRIAGASRVRKTHEKDGAGKGQIREGQADLGEGGDGRGTFSTNPKSLRRCTHHPSAAYAAARARAPAPKATLVSSGSPIPASAEAWSSAIIGNMIASPIMNVMLTNAVISAMSAALRPRGA
jgi:hypothetical protein